MSNEQIYEALTKLLSEEVERLNEIVETMNARLWDVEEELMEKRHEINDLHRALAELESKVG